MNLRETFFFYQPLREVYHTAACTEDNNQFNKYIQNILIQKFC